MRHAHTLVPLLALLAFAAPAHAAAGVSLRWDHCYGDVGTPNKNFACNTNSGSETLVGSFTLASDLLQATGNEIVLQVATAASVLPQWWQFKNLGSCRASSMTLGFLSPSVSCPDWANGSASGGIGAYFVGSRGPNTAKLTMAAAVPPAGPQDLAGGQEYYSFSLLIDHQKTVGTASCGGCTSAACLNLISINVKTADLANHVLLTGPANGFDSEWASWQGGGGVVVNGIAGCDGATPTRQRTWGAIKSLYR